MNVEIGTEAALFPEKEYITGIFLAVWTVTVTIKLPMIIPVNSPVQGRSSPGESTGRSMCMKLSYNSSKWSVTRDYFFFFSVYKLRFLAKLPMRQIES